MCTKNFPRKFDEPQFKDTETNEETNFEEKSDMKQKIMNSKTTRSLGKLRR